MAARCGSRSPTYNNVKSQIKKLLHNTASPSAESSNKKDAWKTLKQVSAVFECPFWTVDLQRLCLLRSYDEDRGPTNRKERH